MSSPAIFVPGVNVFGVTLTFQIDHEPEQSRLRGNHDWRDELTVEHCVPIIGAANANASVQGRVTVGVSGQNPPYQAGSSLLYTPRGAGVQTNMRFWFQGIWYGTRGQQRFDLDHVLTGENFGYIEWMIVKGG